MNLEDDQHLATIPHFLRLSERIGTAGQPDESQFAIIRQAGYEAVLNLRPLDAALPHEQALVEKEGMAYFSVPIVWEAPTVGDIEQFFHVMQANADKKIFVHCALNMRVSACMYLYRVLQEKVEPGQAAIDLHRIWTPNPTWQALMDQILAGAPGGQAER